MVSYALGTTALLVAGAHAANEPSQLRNRTQKKRQLEQRKLYSSKPETSEDMPTYWPTYSPTADDWSGSKDTDEPTASPVDEWNGGGWNHYSTSEDGWKSPRVGRCTSKSEKSWSPPAWSGSKSKSLTSIDEWSSSSSPDAWYSPYESSSSSSKSGKGSKSSGDGWEGSSKGGKGGSSKGGKGSKGGDDDWEPSSPDHWWGGSRKLRANAKPQVPPGVARAILDGKDAAKDNGGRKLWWFGKGWEASAVTADSWDSPATVDSWDGSSSKSGKGTSSGSEGKSGKGTSGGTGWSSGKSGKGSKGHGKGGKSKGGKSKSSKTSWHASPSPTICEDPTDYPTAFPTVEPTLAPTTCEGERKWWYNEDDDKCSNFPIPDSYDGEVYDELQECCKKEDFGYGKCKYEDYCKEPTKKPTRKPTKKPTSKPTKKPTSKPTNKPTKKEIIFECDYPEWFYIDIKDGACMYADVPKEDYIPITTGYDTADACCEDNYDDKDDCNVKNICGTPDPTDSPTESPTMEPTKKCTDPMWWPIPGDKCIYDDVPKDYDPNTYDTKYECCKEEFDDKYCDAVIICPLDTPEPTAEPTLSPTVCEERQWFRDEDTCTNGPQSTSNDSSTTMYETYKECCAGEFTSGYAKCKKDDTCAPTASPTPAVTEGSTPTVSKETEFATLPPVPRPQ